MEEDRNAELRHVLRSHLTVIRGWAQLASRERAKSDPDEARLTTYGANLDAGIQALDREIEQQFGPDGQDADATAPSGAS